MQKLFLNIILNITLIILVLTNLTSCYPAIFTGATTSAMEFAKDRSGKETVADIKIATGIKTALLKKNFKGIYTRVNVKVIQGRILLTGIVEKEEYALSAVQVAWDQPGVVEVLNEIMVNKDSNNFDIVQYTRDAMITSQIKSKIFINRDIKFINYTVITINDVVYLFGIARSEQELEKVGKIAANIHGVVKVVSHVKLRKLVKDDDQEQGAQEEIDENIPNKEDGVILEDNTKPNNDSQEVKDSEDDSEIIGN